MVKKITVLVFILLLCTLLGDASTDIIRYQNVLTGENENWSVVYMQNGAGWFTQASAGLHYDSNYNDILTVTYKKDLSTLASVRHFKIGYQIGSGTGWLEGDDVASLFLRKSYTNRNINSLPIQQSTTATVTIELDGVVQSIELKHNPLYQIAAVIGPSAPINRIYP